MNTTFARFALTLPVAFALGCDNGSDQDDTVEATSAALTASDSEGTDAQLGSLAFARGGAGLTAAERIANLRAHIAESLTCAEVGPSDGDAVSLTFGKTCSWNGRRWTGTIDVAYAADGSSASLDFEGVSVNGGTISGSIDVTWLAERHVTVVADTSRSVVTPRRTRAVTGRWEGEYLWDDTSYTVVSADHTVTINGITATRSVDGVVWLRNATSPESGSVTVTGFRGKTWSFVFGVSEGVHQVSVTRPDGTTRTFDIAVDGELGDGV